jgi:hypothetical protein
MREGIVMAGSKVCWQARQVGRGMLAPPLTALAAWAGGVVASGALSTASAFAVVTWAVQIYVIVTGVCMAAALTGDPLIELSESLPTPFRTVQSLRAGLVGGASLLSTAGMFLALRTFDLWPRPQGWAGLLDVTGAVALVSEAVCVVAAFSGNASSSVIAAVTAWMALTLLWDPYVTSLLAQRGLPLAAGALLLPLLWRRWGDAERNLAGAAS